MGAKKANLVIQVEGGPGKDRALNRALRRLHEESSPILREFRDHSQYLPPRELERRKASRSRRGSTILPMDETTALIISSFGRTQRRSGKSLPKTRVDLGKLVAAEKYYASVISIVIFLASPPRIFVQKEAKKSAPGFISASIEPREHPIDAIVRELPEECGLEAPREAFLVIGEIPIGRDGAHAVVTAITFPASAMAEVKPETDPETDEPLARIDFLTYAEIEELIARNQFLTNARNAWKLFKDVGIPLLRAHLTSQHS